MSMKAFCWLGKGHVEVNVVDDPRIADPTDMIIKVAASGICGSDLHLYDGYVPTMEKGDSGFIDKYPIGAFFSKGLTLRTGQTHVHKYLPRLLDLIRDGRIRPDEVVSHHISLDQAPEYYRIFRDKENECLKTIIRF
jgi:threonine dehydrogenase-like Zn-dependent dehydrogenase